VAFLVGGEVGLDTSDATRDYITCIVPTGRLSRVRRVQVAEGAGMGHISARNPDITRLVDRLGRAAW